MNVYDFDNTILRGDSTARFFAYCLLRTPRMWLDATGQILNGLLFLAKARKKQVFKQRMLRFLRWIDLQSVLPAFWEKNLSRVKPFYGTAHREDDVVISASPEFLIRPACAHLGISHVMGSPVDPRSGIFRGPNCHGEEKVRRFREAFPQGKIDAFYSDSHSDDPLARLAQRAILVKGDKLLPWNDA